MKRFPITQEDRRFILALEESANLFMVMFKIYPHPVNQDTLAFELKWDKRKAKKRLDDLASDGFTLLMKGQGYVLTDPARRMFANFFADAMMLPLEAQALAPESQAQAQQALSSGGDQVIELETSIPALGNSADLAHTVRVPLKKEEESINLRINKDSSSESEKDAQIVRVDVLEFAPGVTVRRMLEHSNILFGDEGVFISGLAVDVIQPHYALAWLAQAYHQRCRPDYPKGLVEPAGLVYKRLKDSERPKPRASYYADPESYLPDEYLMAIGLLNHACESCKQEFESAGELAKHQERMYRCEHECGAKCHTPEELEAHHKTHEKQSAVQVAVYSVLDADDRGARAWKLVMGELHNDLPKASFETWVRDTHAVQFEGKVLKVAVRNAYACDWLNSRLKTKVNAMLEKFTNEKISVVFVVGSVEGADEL